MAIIDKRKKAAAAAAVETAERDEDVTGAYEQVAASDDDSDDKDAFVTPARVDENGLAVTITAKQLKAALALVKPAVSTRSTLAVLSHVLLRRSANPASLRMAATNLEVGVAVDVPLDGLMPEEGATTLPAGIFNDFIATLPAASAVKLTTDALTHKTKIEAPRSKATLKSLSPDDFPNIPFDDFDHAAIVRMQARALRLLIASVVDFAAKDDSRPVFTGVEVRFTEGKITAAAADAFRLAKMTINAEVPEELHNRFVLIPARSLKMLADIMPAIGDIEMSVKLSGASLGTRVMFRAVSESATITFMTNLIAGMFPNWQAIVPKRQDGDTQARFNRRSAQAALKAVNLFARDSANIVKVYVDADASTVTLNAESEDVGDTSQVIDGVDVTGPSGAIILNSAFLRDTLAVLTGELVDFRIGHANMHGDGFSASPSAIYAPDGEPEQVEHFIGVVMPMHSTK